MIKAIVLFLSSLMFIHASTNSINPKFTPLEEQFIKSHKKIKVANEMDWPPFDYNEYGKPKGLSIDHLRLVAKKIGIEIEFVNGYSWAKLLEEFEAKRIDVMPVMYKNKEREKFTLFSKPYYRGKLGVFARVDDVLHNKEDLINKRVGIEHSHGAIPIIKNSLDGINLIEIKSNSEILTQLATGKLDAIIGNPLLFYFYAKENQIINIELKHYIDMDDNEQLDTSFHIGIRDDWPLLQSIINKTMDSLTTGDTTEIEYRWTGFGNLEDAKQDIPLTESEKLYLKSHPVIKISNELDFPPFDFAVEGMPQGYSIDLINLLAKHIGIKIEYVNGYTWSELIEKFRAKEIDMVHTLNRTPKREKFGDFSKPYRHYKNHFFTKKGVPDITNIEQLYGKTLAVGENWSTHEYISENHPLIKLLPVKNLEEMIEALSSGKVYAFANDKPSTKYLMNKLSITDIKISNWFKEFDRGKSKKFHFMFQPEASELITIFNKALALVSTKEKEELEYKWFGVHDNDTSTLHLNEEEENYLNKKEKIRMCINPNWMPFEEIDNDGKHIGMSAEFMKLLTQRIGTKVELYPTKTWIETLNSVKERSCDLITMAKETRDRKKYLNFTSSYVSFPFVIATTNEKRFIDNFESVSNKIFSVTKGLAIISNIKDSFPKIKFVEVKNIKEGIDLVKSGDVFGYIDGSAPIGHTMQQYNMIGLKIAGNLQWNTELAIATRSDEPLLGNIFQKAIDTLSASEKKRIYNKWIAFKYEKAFDYTLLWQIIVVAIFILFGTLYWNRKIEKARKIATKALSELKIVKNELEEKNLELEHLSVTDRLTQLYNRVRFDEVIENELIRSARYKTAFGIILIDVDYFKNINDTYGHQTGDTVLIQIANILKYSTRSIDIIARWGGEEFIIICPQTDKDGTIKLAESIRKHIEEHEFPEVGHKSISCGVTIYQNGDDDKKIIKRADDALYKAKENGRNRVFAIYQ